MRLTIRYKLLLSFSIVIFVGLTAMLLVSVSITERNVSRIIGKDMVDARHNLEVYTNQYFLIKNMMLDRNTLSGEADGLVKELNTAVGSAVSVYDEKGHGLSSLNVNLAPQSDDFTQALQGSDAYSIRSSGGNTTVSLSVLMHSNGDPIGIIYFEKDYSGLSGFTRQFISAVRGFAIGIFMLILLTVAWLSSRLSKPLERLSRSLEQVSLGRYEPAPPVHGNDEIGDLSRSFNRMVRQIRSQIEIIKQERDALKVTQETTKTFFDNVTHELKTPLTTIRGYSQMLHENGFTDKPFFTKGLRYIMEESSRLNEKVVQIIEYSKSSSERVSMRFEPVDMSALIRRVCDEMSVKAQKYSMEIRCRAEKGLTVQGDELRLREMLVNVIDNAVKYGGIGTFVDCSVDRDWARVRVLIADRGPGIAEEHVRRLFEPFYRVPGTKKEEERGSVGLGLAIVKSIVDSHKGEVEIASRPGGGTAVTIWIEEGGHD
ncbi:sensor histidine kinase [Paenibacillus spongiae]|uniref:histidine kinase n=1 Tax=Paenibacillus spongiae TaxID=2909671 RepID=A0ABY5SAC5_9BACL|nr:HAMP domain-containing sensor histidine kinase [Paenibacillus spongiae]UVI29248.1 HAMP domain-containing histidine kinase [Paenibacillus spongiae]